MQNSEFITDFANIIVVVYFIPLNSRKRSRHQDGALFWASLARLNLLMRRGMADSAELVSPR